MILRLSFDAVMDIGTRIVGTKLTSPRNTRLNASSGEEVLDGDYNPSDEETEVRMSISPTFRPRGRLCRIPYGRVRFARRRMWSLLECPTVTKSDQRVAENEIS
jgi:hypothetical protein